MSNDSINQQRLIPDTREHLICQYAEWLSRQPFSDHTKRNYLSQIERFIMFAVGNAAFDAQVLHSPDQRGSIIDDYVAYLRDTAKCSRSSINTTLTAIASFYRFLGLSVLQSRRERVACKTPRVLTSQEKHNLREIVEKSTSLKDRAVVVLFLSTGIRLGECVALNVGDLVLAGHTAKLVVRHGKAGTYRTIPLDEQTRFALQKWLVERHQIVSNKNEDALFVNSKGQRMSSQGLDLIVRKIGISARLVVSSQVLRDSFLTELAQATNDAFLVAEISGHAKLDSTKRYFDRTVSEAAS